MKKNNNVFPIRVVFKLFEDTFMRNYFLVRLWGIPFCFIPGLRVEHLRLRGGISWHFP